jgi:hypothetical protein
MPRVQGELAKVRALEARRRPPPAERRLGQKAGSSRGLLRPILRPRRPAAVIETEVGKQGGGGADERGGRAPAPAKARTAARLLDQRFERFDFGAIVGTGRAGWCYNAHANSRRH